MLGIVAGYVRQNGFTTSWGIRSYLDGEWTDITYNLDDGGDIQQNFDLWDLKFIGGKLFALLRLFNQWENPSALWRLDGNKWVRVISEDIDFPYCLSTMFCWNGRAYLLGDGYYDPADSHFFSGSFVLYQFNGGGSLKLVAWDELFDMGLTTVRRTCVIPGPRVATASDGALAGELLVGSLESDNWAIYNSDPNTYTPFLESSDFGGSCVFAMGVDNDGVIWSGDFDRFYYYSTDHGHSFIDVQGIRMFADDARAGEHEIRESGLSEVWEFYHWGDRFISVGCDPCTLAIRNSNPIDPNPPSSLAAADGVIAGWDIVMKLVDFFPDLEAHQPGNGFISCEALDDDHLILGFGGEPWYYLASGPGRVFQWNGTTLTDIGGGLDWGFGVHILTSTNRQCHGLGPIPGAHDRQGDRFDPAHEPRGVRRGIRH